MASRRPPPASRRGNSRPSGQGSSASHSQPPGTKPGRGNKGKRDNRRDQKEITIAFERKKSSSQARPFRKNFQAKARPRSDSGDKAPRREQPSRPVSSARRPPCPHYPDCHGCPFIGIPYEQQLDKKQAQVAAAFADYASLRSVSIPTPVASPYRFGYRTRVKLAVQRIKGKPVIGLYRPESHRVIDASACPVHPRPVNALVRTLKQLIETLGITPYDERHDIGQLRYLDIRYSFWQRRLLLTLVTRHMDFPQVRDLTRELRRHCPQLLGVVQNINDTPGREGNSIWGHRFHPLRGRDSLIERMGHLQLHSPADAFTQINPPVADQLYQTVLEWVELSKERIALDLYCGTGPIALYLAGQASLVIGIDDNTRAIRVAKENARRNGYHNTRFFAGDAARQLRQTASQLARVDCIVVNPPRAGLSSHAFTALEAVAAPRLAYVSCEPLSLARDLDHLGQAGYRVAKVQPFDMFPQTDKVETLVLLDRTGRLDSAGDDDRSLPQMVSSTTVETDA